MDDSILINTHRVSFRMEVGPEANVQESQAWNELNRLTGSHAKLEFISRVWFIGYAVYSGGLSGKGFKFKIESKGAGLINAHRISFRMKEGTGANNQDNQAWKELNKIIGLNAKQEFMSRVWFIGYAVYSGQLSSSVVTLKTKDDPEKNAGASNTAVNQNTKNKLGDLM
ncbi:MAG: hypothetical protein QM504_15795 [Pseudomonadota bacterium]